MTFILLFLFGLIIGSFLAALTYRFPKGISINKGRSFCPHCHETISWFDNIPLLSYLWLSGKCRVCKKKISIRYPIIEFSTGIIFALIGFNPFLLFVSSVLISIFVVDYEHMIIPDDFVFIGLLGTFVYLLATPQIFYSNLLMGFVSSLFFLGMYLITLGKGMGLGDVKLAILIGSILGLELSIIWLLSSFIVGGIIATILLVSKKANLKQKIAFGPFLIFGFFVAILFGNKLVYLF